MALSVRTRFEVFKRDGFTCQYCGRKSPDVVLEADHIVPLSGGGSDDVMNITTSCWECNHGKSGVLLGQIMTGEDPHDRAIVLLERERQLAEYNKVLAAEHKRRKKEAWALVKYWKRQLGYTDKKDLTEIRRQDFNWLFNALRWCPSEQIRQFMDMAVNRGFTQNLKYTGACCRNWRYEHVAAKDMRGDDE